MFAPRFSKRVWQSAQVLLIGLILVLGKPTVSAILRVMGLGEAKNYFLGRNGYEPYRFGRS